MVITPTRRVLLSKIIPLATVLSIVGSHAGLSVFVQTRSHFDGGTLIQLDHPLAAFPPMVFSNVCVQVSLSTWLRIAIILWLTKSAQCVR